MTRRRIAPVLVLALLGLLAPSQTAVAADAVPTIVSHRAPDQVDLSGGGYALSIIGTNLDDATKVMLGSHSVAPSSQGTSYVSIEMPAEPKGTYPVKLAFSDGSTVDARFSVTYLDFRAEVLRLTNKARSVARKCGTTKYKKVKALKSSSKLTKAAKAHASDMASRNYFSHYTKGTGKSPFDRMKAAGVRATWRGENIAAGYATPSSVVQAWIKSPGHCKNLMSKHYSYLGVGYAVDDASDYGSYWVQDFSS